MSKKIGILKAVIIEKMGAEGYCIARVDGRVFFVEGAAPGDVVDLQVIRKKKNQYITKPIYFHQKSKHRVTPPCPHFDICGGCKWQHIDYNVQVEYKRQQVIDQFSRIGKFEFGEVNAIIKAKQTFEYRGKMEFSASNKRWLTQHEIQSNKTFSLNALGLHKPGFYDKVLDIQNCHLQPTFSDEIRNTIKRYCEEQGITFYDIKAQKGWLRSVMIRYTTLNQWMVLVLVNEENPKQIKGLFSHLNKTTPNIDAQLYAINNKANDSFFDLDIKLFKGKTYVEEKIDGLTFRINAKSFFQTNPLQVQKLYQYVQKMAKLTGNELVYDLYTGTGSIACYLATHAKKIIGIESVPEAIHDAEINAKNNNIHNLNFFIGDMKPMFNTDFVHENGKPDVIITDPPRMGMHPKVIKNLLKVEAPIIIYVSCNPATQARDLTLLSTKYKICEIQPVDMYPHTHHIENLVKLELK